MKSVIASLVIAGLAVLSSHPVAAQAPSYLTQDLVAVAGPPDASGGCGGTGSYTLNLIGGTISRTGDTAFNHLAVGYTCWIFDEQYVRIYMVADDPATFDHWESPSGHLYLLDGHNGTSELTIETSFNLLGQSPTFEAVHSGGTPAPTLLALNRLTAVPSLVSPMSGGASDVYPALAIHPKTKVMYAGGGNGSPTLHTVDPTTGALTQIGDAGSGITRIGAMDFRSDGVLFAAVKAGANRAPGANYLATIDTATGAATLLGPFGTCGVNCSIEGMEAIAFDLDDVLYGALHERAQSGTPGLYTINASTGMASFVASILDGAAEPASGGITSLHFSEGLLFGGTGIAKEPPGDGGWLVRINKSTGLFWKLGASSPTGGRGIIALAGYGFHCSLQTDVPLEECAALVDFFEGLDGVHWSNNTRWTKTNQPCTWYGVTCASGHVSELDLFWNGLSGHLSESLQDLSHLTRLILTLGNLSGPMPEWMGNMSALTYLDMYQTGLSGTLPESIGNLSNLTYLDLNYNDLAGPIPTSIGSLTNLETFDIIENELTGSIPESIGNLANLKRLSLDANLLTGPIPESIGNLADLEWFSASNNGLEGPIPDSLTGLSQLGVLLLFGNHLTGTIPTSIGNLSSMYELNLDYNDIGGPIPESIGRLTNLQVLSLRENQLVGPLPQSIGKLVSLTRLGLSDNHLTGRLSPTLANLTGLSTVELHENNFEGAVPLPVAAMMSEVPWGCTADDNPGLCLPDIPPYQAFAPGGSLCGLPLDPDCEPIVHVEATVLLQGPYAGGVMQTGKAFAEHCPSEQPYSDPIFEDTPLECHASDVALAPPDSAIDWVLLELRTGTEPVTFVPSSRRPAFVRANGTVVDTAGSILGFPGIAPGNYYVIVRHRNHADVMSASPVDFLTGLGSWDFTTSMAQAYTGRAAPMKQFADGRFGMFACDASVDGEITAPDFNLWIAATSAGASGYQQTDCNLDGYVTAPDFNLWNANTSAGASSQVPE